MEFILKRVKMTVTNIIHISKFPVQQLNILISGGTGNATFFLSKEATAILHVFWVYAKRFPFSSNSPHALSKPPRQISLNGLLTPYPLHTLTHIHKQTHIQNHLSHIHFPPLFLPGHRSARGKESVLIWQSEQPFHRASLRSVPVPEWELLISPGRLACRRLLGSPAREGPREGGGAGVRALVRAWQAADKSSSCCSCMHLPLLLELSISLCLPHTHTHMHIAFFSPHMWGTNNNFGVLVSQPSFLRQG